MGLVLPAMGEPKRKARRLAVMNGPDQLFMALPVPPEVAAEESDGSVECLELAVAKTIVKKEQQE